MSNMRETIWGKEDIQRIYGEIQKLEPSSPDFWSRLIKFASQECKNIPSVMGPDECKTLYSPQHFEYLMWTLGFICEAWLLRNFQIKYEEGHCNEHRSRTNQPCNLTKPLHRTLLYLSAQTFKEVAGIMTESDEKVGEYVKTY